MTSSDAAVPDERGCPLATVTDATEPRAPTSDELRAFAPQWCLFWAGSVIPSQFAIWSPYVSRSRYRWLIVARKGTVPDEIRSAIDAMPNALVMEATDQSIRALKRIDSLKGFLYILGFKAANFINVNSFRNHAHIWIAHGESEKVSSAPRTASMYDSVFLARYKAVGRFPRSIRPWIGRGACAIGAPVMEAIAPDPWDDPRPIRTILYAPTWEGYSDSTNYSSLLDGGARLAASLPALIERGVKVIVRPHPNTGKRMPEHGSIVDALFAGGAVRSSDKAVDFGAADVMISDISGVTAEWLFTEKPSIMPTSARLAMIDRPPERLRREHPWMYQWDPAKDDLLEMLSALERSDPLRGQRKAMARSLYRAHRSLDEAVATFDLALSAIGFRKTPIPVRWAFEALRLPGVGTARTIVRRIRRQRPRSVRVRR